MSSAEDRQKSKAVRKPHLFTYKDVLRIVRVVEIPDDPERGWEQLGEASAAVFAVLSDVWSAIAVLAGRQKAAFVLRLVARLYAFIFDLLSLLPELAGSRIQLLLDSFLENPISWRDENDGQGSS